MKQFSALFVLALSVSAHALYLAPGTYVPPTSETHSVWRGPTRPASDDDVLRTITPEEREFLPPAYIAWLESEQKVALDERVIIGEPDMAKFHRPLEIYSADRYTFPERSAPDRVSILPATQGLRQ